MVEINFIGQLVDSMEIALDKLEKALVKGDTEYANRLKTFIFDLHRQIDSNLGGKNV